MPELRKRQREVDYTGGKQDADRSKRTTATRAKKPKTAKEPAAPTTKAKRVAATPVEAAEPKESKEPKGPKESKKNAPAAAAKSDSAPAKKNASAKNASAKKNASAAPKKNAPGTKKNASANATNKQAAKKYKDIITAVSKAYAQLEKGYKLNPTEFDGVTSDDCAKRMLQFLPDVESLEAMSPPALKHAFDLLVYLGEHGHADLDFSVKMCGWGGAADAYEKLDAAMVRVIDARVQAEGTAPAPSPEGEGEEGEKEEDTSDHELGAFMQLLGEKQPNKNERTRINKLRKEQFKRKVETKRLRREKARDWVANALPDLVAKRDYLEKYGIGEKYFTQSIAKLQKLKDSPPQGPAKVEKEEEEKADEKKGEDKDKKKENEEAGGEEEEDAAGEDDE